MEFTGERYVPELLSAKISYEHWHRYIFSSRFCGHKKVLDIACGEGYGTAFLSAQASHITGVDVSPEAITHAHAKYGNQRVQFVQAPASQLPFEKGSFDTIVSFETLEHLNKEDQQLFMAEAVRVLHKTGLLLISTPNKKVYSDDAQYANPYHLAEFYRSEFEAFLKTYFRHVLLFDQEIIGGSIISRPKEDLYNIDRLHIGAGGFVPGSTHQNRGTEYLIAVCSHEHLSSISGSILLDEDNALIKEHYNAK